MTRRAGVDRKAYTCEQVMTFLSNWFSVERAAHRQECHRMSVNIDNYRRFMTPFDCHEPDSSGACPGAGGDNRRSAAEGPRKSRAAAVISLAAGATRPPGKSRSRPL